jgi:hypothetical protein
MNKADNKEKTKLPFSENSSFQEKYTQHSQFFFYELKKIKKNHNFLRYTNHLSKVFGNVRKSLYNQPKPYFFKTLL